jgi:hypothetical protein
VVAVVYVVVSLRRLVHVTFVHWLWKVVFAVAFDNQVDRVVAAAVDDEC